MSVSALGQGGGGCQSVVHFIGLDQDLLFSYVAESTMVIISSKEYGNLSMTNEPVPECDPGVKKSLPSERS